MLGALLFALMIVQAPAGQGGVEGFLELDGLLSAGDYRNYQRKEKYHDRLKILRTNLESRQRAIPSAIRERQIPVIFRTLLEIRGLCRHAMDESRKETNPKELTHREVKKLEIQLRKMVEGLTSFRLEVPYEDRHHFDVTQTIVESLRDQLLRQLFGKAIAATGPPSGSSAFQETVRFAAGSSASGSASQGLWDKDKFTEAEFTKIQYAQELDKRVEAFLEIAEARLVEIDRRWKGKEWEEKEPNPLEFYMYEELVLAYDRAIEGAMTNIDAQAELGFTPEKDIKKALKRLSKKVQEFGPRLDGLEDLIRKERDEALYDRWRKAQKSTEIARKGAAYGLGAPEE